MMTRIQYLDGLRGIAILLVVFFHAFVRWPEVLPYGNSYAEFPVFKYGYLGVELFFLLSGFVILMTLEKCNDGVIFLYRRWLRLFPAMLACTLLIYFTTGIFTERPNGEVEFKDLFTGLSFIEPYIWLKATGIELESIEGSFWSLYVEFKFYVISAIFYFLMGSKRLVLALFACFLTWWLAKFLNSIYSINALTHLQSLTSLFSFKYFGWFSSGAAFYLYTKNKSIKWFVFGGVVATLSSLSESGAQLGPFLAAMLISILFALSLVSEKLQSILSNKFLLFFGFISYPLYLLHENMMISLTIQFSKYTDVLPSVVFPFVAISLISGIAYIVSKKVEPNLKGGLAKSIATFGKFSVFSRLKKSA